MRMSADMEMGQKTVILGQGEGSALPRPASKDSPNALMGVGREKERGFMLGGGKWGS